MLAKKEKVREFHTCLKMGDTLLYTQGKNKRGRGRKVVLTCYIDTVYVWWCHNLAKSVVVTGNIDVVVGSKQVELFNEISLTRTLYKKNGTIGVCVCVCVCVCV